MKTEQQKKYQPVRRPRQAAPQRERELRNQDKFLEKEQDELDLDAPRRQRRALSHVGGEVQFWGGSPEEQDIVARALDVSADEDEVMVDVHGFHSYPARLHPLTARRLIEGLSKEGDRVLDPFCGSGTVVVEARALSRNAFGSDLNPLAVELAWLKSRGPNRKLIGETVATAKRIAEVAEERRLAKAEPYAKYPDEDRERYPIHILLELDSLAHGISLVGRTEPARILRLVISSMLTKLAHSEGDTTRRKSPRRLPSGFAIQLFIQKTEELGRRLESYLARVPERSPRAHVFCEDARELETIESDSIDLIVTSPPYPGVYDYLDHHLHRIQWLGLHAGRLKTNEIGARRKYRRLRLEEAERFWRDEITAVLYELRRTLAPTGRGVLIIADSVIDRRPLRADEQLRRVAEEAGIKITCVASQERPLFLHGADQAFSDRPRMEHLVVFRPGERPARRPRIRLDADEGGSYRGSAIGPHSRAASRTEPSYGGDGRRGPPRHGSPSPRDHFEERSDNSRQRSSGFGDRRDSSRDFSQRGGMPGRERSGGGFGDRRDNSRERSGGGFGDRRDNSRERSSGFGDRRDSSRDFSQRGGMPGRERSGGFDDRRDNSRERSSGFGDRRDSSRDFSQRGGMPGRERSGGGGFGNARTDRTDTRERAAFADRSPSRGSWERPERSDHQRSDHQRSDHQRSERGRPGRDQRPSQERTWDSRPRGASIPRSKSPRKPR